MMEHVVAGNGIVTKYFLQSIVLFPLTS